jgi:hypothetical protein
MDNYTGIALDGPYNGLYVGIQVSIRDAAYEGYYKHDNLFPNEDVWAQFPPGEDPTPEEFRDDPS